MDQTCSRLVSKLFVALLLSGSLTFVARAQAPTPPAGKQAPTASPAPAAGKPAGPTAETPEPADKVVLKIGDQQYTKADMDLLIENLSPASTTQHCHPGTETAGGPVCADGDALPAGADPSFGPDAGLYSQVGFTKTADGGANGF